MNASEGEPRSVGLCPLTIWLLPNTLSGNSVEPIRATLRVTVFRLGQDEEVLKEQSVCMLTQTFIEFV